jgi:uncharacterized protein (TIRG00374 family)
MQAHPIGKYFKTIIRVVVFLAIGAGILYLLYRGQNAKYLEECALKGIPESDCSLVEKVWTDFLSVNPVWLVLVLLAFMLSNLSRAHRWQMLFRAMGLKARFGTAFFTIMFGYLANLGVPRIGEVLRAAMLARYEGLPVEKSMGTVVVDRAIDVLTLLLMIVLAFIVQFGVIYGYLRENLNINATAGAILIPLFLVVLASGAALWFGRNRIRKWPLVRRFRKTILGFIDGVKSVRSVHNPGLFIAHSLFIWLMYFMMNYLCIKAFVPTDHLGVAAALVVFVFGALGIVFPSPGGMGTYHAMIIAALVIYDISSEDAFSFANILYFSIQIFCNVLFGVMALIALPLIHRKQQKIENSG